jgi:hypothetical protein
MAANEDRDCVADCWFVNPSLIQQKAESLKHESATYAYCLLESQGIVKKRDSRNNVDGAQ